MNNSGDAGQFDNTYHYPPELFELLCDTIPRLSKSKQGVIDFFRGAGILSPLLSGWQTKLNTDNLCAREGFEGGLSSPRTMAGSFARSNAPPADSE